VKKLNQKHIDKVIELINSSPYFSLLSINVCVIEHGYCKIEIILDEKHLNPFGGLHGGVYSSSIDTAAYWAVYGSVDEDIGLISIDLHVDNISTVQKGKIIVEGKQIKAGRTICFSEGTIMDENGKILAHGLSKILVTDKLQTINQAVMAMGYEALPPKYLE
jgi:uncharacterized protein (TIGR00369 family)